MSTNKISNSSNGEGDVWSPTHYVVASRGMLIPVRVTSIDENRVFFTTQRGLTQTCHVRDIIPEDVE